MKRRIFIALGILTGCYFLHFIFCSRSPLPWFSEYFVNSDMHSNLEWARGIREQGWLNPHPYHPYDTWMRQTAPYEAWVKLWGGAAIFQRSPLYAYLVAFYLIFTSNLLYFYFLQCLSGVLLCVLLGLLGWKVFEDPGTGWISFLIAALYGPFYGYSFPLLRDFISWIILAASLLSLDLWWKSWKNRRPSFLLSALTGALLGLGFLARETFLLIAFIAILLIFWRGIREKCLSPTLLVCFFALLTILPLLIRNAKVEAPLFSTSNRFAESFIMGNAASAHPYLPSLPKETSLIIQKSDSKPFQAILETLATHRDHPWGFISLQLRKLLALFDPFEAADNWSLYFVAEFSPFVRFGLRHWMILIPGLGGLLLGIHRRDKRQIWFWLFLLVQLDGLLVAQVHSRFRQALAILWIPWAAWFAMEMFKCFRRMPGKALLGVIFLFIGWGLCLAPLSIQPRDQYERFAEYHVASIIYMNKGQPEKAREMLKLYQKRNKTRKL